MNLERVKQDLKAIFIPFAQEWLKDFTLESYSKRTIRAQSRYTRKWMRNNLKPFQERKKHKYYLRKRRVCYDDRRSKKDIHKILNFIAFFVRTIKRKYGMH